MQTSEALEALQSRLQHRFTNEALLRQALTHPSMMNEANYQRLEFLGDAVLGLLIAELLYALYPQAAEGELAKWQAALVRGGTLTEVARSIHLRDTLRLGQSELQGDGRGLDSNLEDACEALIGAMYLDAGLEVARRFVKEHWSERARAVQNLQRDAKTRLQETAQSIGLPLPIYRLVSADGPAHAPHFTIEVSLPNYAPALGEGSSKRIAEQAAAALLLEALPGKKGEKA